MGNLHKMQAPLLPSNLLHHLSGEKKQFSYLPDLFDLAATFANERATLAGRHNNAQCDRRLGGGCTVGHGAADILKKKQKRR